jgi:hypothetical protein
MSRVSGGAVWSNCPRTDLARAGAGKLAPATLHKVFSSNPRSTRLSEISRLSGLGKSVRLIGPAKIGVYLRLAFVSSKSSQFRTAE